MKFTFINNACSIIEATGFKFLTDPWMSPGVFDGAWFPAIPLKTKLQDVLGADAIYISHLHEDHCDKPFLATCPKDKPLFILDDEGPNFLRRILERNGFRNLNTVKSGASATIGPFTVRIFRPFAGSVFDEVAVGNLIDSAILFSANGFNLLNTNDNTLTKEAAEAFAPLKIDLALLNYGSAGAYPACFPDLSPEQRLAERRRILARNMNHFIDLADILQPRYAMQFAGDYMLGGKNFPKNPYLPSGDESLFRSVLDSTADSNRSWKLIHLTEGQTFDLAAGEITGEPRVVPREEQEAYNRSVQSRPFPYEQTEPLKLESLSDKLTLARNKLFQKQKTYNVFPDLNMYIRTDGGTVVFNFLEDSVRVDGHIPVSEMREPFLCADLDSRLFKAILHRDTNWNNAIIGCHFDFRRKPNVWIPDVDTIMSFFQV
jgi:UDP-MurNAc hydroxylase